MLDGRNTFGLWPVQGGFRNIKISTKTQMMLMIFTVNLTCSKYVIRLSGQFSEEEVIKLIHSVNSELKQSG